METKSTTTILQSILDVKILANIRPEIEASRPRCCPSCGAAAGLPGALRIHGHGCRERDLWGPPTPSGSAEVLTVVLRRFRCLACGHVMTVRPALIARYFRYATAAIALALWLWTALSRSPSEVRAEISPWLVRGATEADRWKSLRRWTQRASALFGLPDGLHGVTAREVAARVTALLVGRAPPDLADRVRVFAGAQLR